MKKIFILTVLVFLPWISILSQELTATYQYLSPNIFSSYEQPIGLAIFKFSGGDDIEKQLYNELKNQNGIHEKFTIYSFDVLEAKKQVLEIRKFDANNKKVLKSLSNNLDIKLIVTGSGNTNNFRIEIIRSDDGNKVYETEYKKSANSTAVKDAIRLFNKNEKAIYRDQYADPIAYLGKTYNTVMIGNQRWFKENLDIGQMIKGGRTYRETQTDNGIIEKYCYDNDPVNCDKYGGLYEWGEAMQYSTSEGAQGICPSGWHIPTRSEFETLIDNVNNDANSLKREDQETGIDKGLNSSGFSATISGNYRGNNIFMDFGYYTGFWSSSSFEYDATRARYLGVGSNVKLGELKKQWGFAVRCIKD